MPDSLLVALRDLLPAWAIWAPLVVWPLLAALFTVVAAVPALWWSARPLNKARESHWTDRARLLMAPRVVTTFAVFMTPAMLVALVPFDLWISPIPEWSVRLAMVGAVVVTALALHTRWIGRHLDPRPALGAVIRGFVNHTVIRFAHILAVVALGVSWAALAPLGPGRYAVLIATFMVFAFNLQLHLLIAAGALRAPDPSVVTTVHGVAETVGVAVRRVLTGNIGQANAFAFPATGDVVFTEQALRVLSSDEVAAVAAHEIGHLASPKRVLYLRMLPTFVLYLFPVVLDLPRSSQAVGAGVVFVLLLALSIAIGKVLRRDEEDADEVAGRLEAGEGVYASALEKLYQANMMPVVMARKNAVHPHLYDRMLEAGVQPSYPRPEPPSRRAGVGPAVFMAVVTMGLVFVPESVTRWAVLDADTDPERAALASVALGLGRSYELALLGNVAFMAPDWDRAATFYAAANHLDPGYYYYLANLGAAEAGAGRCEEARTHWAEATTLAIEANVDLKAYPDLEAMVFFCGDAAGQ